MKRKFIIASLIVIIVSVSVVAASPAFKKVTGLVRSDYSIKVNGETVKLNNEPVTIDGVTYLPLRETATLLGSDVSFDNGIIGLKSKGSEAVTTSTNFEIKEAKYIPNDKYSFETDTLLSIKFDVLVQSTSIDTFNEASFFRYVTSATKQYKEFIVPVTHKVAPNEKTTLEVLVPITSKDIVSVTFRNPTTKEEVTLSLSDL